MRNHIPGNSPNFKRLAVGFERRMEEMGVLDQDGEKWMSLTTYETPTYNFSVLKAPQKLWEMQICFYRCTNGFLAWLASLEYSSSAQIMYYREPNYSPLEKKNHSLGISDWLQSQITKLFYCINECRI